MAEDVAAPPELGEDAAMHLGEVNSMPPPCPHKRRKRRKKSSSIPHCLEAISQPAEGPEAVLEAITEPTVGPEAIPEPAAGPEAAQGPCL